jgi:hypothetical protein
MHVLHLWLAKESLSNDWQKTFVKKVAYLFVVYTNELQLFRNTAFHLLGDRAPMHPHEVD